MVLITNAAESNRAALKFIKEVTWGTTPTTGTVKEVRFTSSDLEASKDTKVSEEIRSDRMVPNIIEVAASSGGSVDVEFSAGSLDPFFEAFLLSEFSEPMTFFQLKGSSVSVTDNNTITLAGADYTGYFTVGHWVKLEGFTTVGNNGYFLLTAKAFGSGNTTLDVSGTPLTTEAGSAFTKIFDANDVLAYASTIFFSSGNTVDGGGANAFGGVVVGQKVYLEGLGKGSGTLQFLATDPTAGDTVTLDDGVNEPLVFEIHTSSASVAEGNIYVALSGTPATMAANLTTAINAQFIANTIDMSATVVTDTVTVVNHKGAGGSIAASGSGVSVTVVALSGGSATKSGFYTVASVIDNDTFTVSETLTADANAGVVNVVVKGSHLRNPGDSADITKQSFSIETGFTDVSKYFLMNGMRVGGIELSVSSGDLVSAKVDFMGSATVRSSTETLTGGSYVELEAVGTDVLNATSNVGQITKDGSELTSAIMELEFKGEAGLREQRAIGEKFPAGIGYGRLAITGSFSAYFQDFTLYDTFINHVTTSLGFDFSDVDLNTYYFGFPSLKITSDKIVPDGIDKDVMDESDFTVQRDTALRTMMTVDRFSSVRPFTDA